SGSRFDTANPRDSIRRIGVGTTFDIFQIIHILYLEYDVLSFSGYGVLSLFPLWSLYDKDVHDLRSIENEFPAIAFNDSLTSGETLSCEPTVSSLNDEIDFKISFDDSDDKDCTVVFDKNSFSYKTIPTNDLKTDSENDNEKVNMPLSPLPEPTVSCFDDLDFFKKLRMNSQPLFTMMLKRLN
ncbi:hypothetical protein Tco_1150564, partial [Tanacetum coccineum]